MHKLAARLTALSAIVGAAALCVLAYQGSRTRELPGTTTPYQAVALANGQVFFGRLTGGGQDFLTLRDVFYVQARQNATTGALANVLVKRGAEPHAPDSMQIARQQVLLVEPVREGSALARLIAAQQAAAGK